MPRSDVRLQRIEPARAADHGGIRPTTDEVFGSVVHAEMSHFCLTAGRGKTVRARLHAERIHQVDEVLVDGRIRVLGRGAAALTDGADALAGGAVKFAVPAREIGG